MTVRISQGIPSQRALHEERGADTAEHRTQRHDAAPSNADARTAGSADVSSRRARPRTDGQTPQPTRRARDNAALTAKLQSIALTLKGDADQLDIANKKSMKNQRGLGDGQISWSDIQARIETANGALQKTLQSIDKNVFDALRGDNRYIQVKDLGTPSAWKPQTAKSDATSPSSIYKPGDTTPVRGSTQALDIDALRNKYAHIDSRGVVTAVYPRGSGAPNGGPSAFGAKLFSKPMFPAEEAELHYQMKPEAGFDWARGGKLPGLFMGKGVACGGKRCDTASSARLMWQKDGSVIGYLYTMLGTKNADLKHGKYGAGVFNNQGLMLKPGDWNDIRVRVKLNTIDSNGRPRSDGEFQLTVNGKSLTMDGIQWRTTDKTKITAGYIVSAFGGPEESPKTQSTQFKGFEVTKVS